MTTPATLNPTTLTPEEVNPVTTTITVNPLIGTPLQIFGPLAETEVEDFAASFDPPLDLGSILIALKDPDAGPTIMVMIENFMYVELDAIMDKPQSSWTADETAFVNGFLNYINAQRAAAANKALADYEAWAKATVAEEDAKIKQDTGQTQLMEIAALSANPPVPPETFLDEVFERHGRQQLPGGDDARGNGRDRRSRKRHERHGQRCLHDLSYGPDFLGTGQGLDDVQ